MPSRKPVTKILPLRHLLFKLFSEKFFPTYTLPFSLLLSRGPSLCPSSHKMFCMHPFLSRRTILTMQYQPTPKMEVLNML